VLKGLSWSWRWGYCLGLDLGVESTLLFLILLFRVLTWSWSCSWRREYYFGRDLAVKSTVCVLILMMRVLAWFRFDVEGTDLVLVSVASVLVLLLASRVLFWSWSCCWEYCLHSDLDDEGNLVWFWCWGYGLGIGRCQASWSWSWRWEYWLILDIGVEGTDSILVSALRLLSWPITEPDLHLVMLFGVQLELDNMADEFRRIHKERHGMIEQLENLLSLMQKRDQDVHDLAEVWSPFSFLSVTSFLSLSSLVHPC